MMTMSITHQRYNQPQATQHVGAAMAATAAAGARDTTRLEPLVYTFNS